MREDIFIKGAKQNNLKNIDVSIPRNKLVVFTGISGSGKSTLAFDTLFAEGQRRYIESLSSYARQFLGQMDKPDVEYIDGLSPAISIDQKTTSNNPRSTVGTVTEIYDYLRLLYARIGKPHCPDCGREISKQSVDTITDSIMKLKEGTKILIEAPIARGKKGEYTKELASYRKNGYIRAKIDGEVVSIEEDIRLDKNIRHNISIIVDRLVVKEGILQRLTESVEAALKLAEGIVNIDADGENTLYSTNYACVRCGISIEEIEPRLFSFNSPFGACGECHGLGYKLVIDEDLVIGDRNKSIREGALTISGWNMENGKMSEMYYRALAKKYNFSLETPVKDLPGEILDIMLYGTDEKIDMQYSSHNFTGSYKSSFEGLINNLNRRYRETTSDYIKSEIERYMKTMPCGQCGGKRLKREALSVTVAGKNIFEICEYAIDKLIDFFGGLKEKLSQTELFISDRILKEINARLNFLTNVGLNYLTLSRNAGTLSGGEAQRIRLATQIGSGLTGILYILDEPSIGLHQRDNDKLLDTLKRLRDLGNTVIVVEHDEDTIRTADHIIDIGPGAGLSGGYVVAQGSLEDIMKCEKSVTGQYLTGKKFIPLPQSRKTLSGNFISIKGARQNNLKGIDVNIPTGMITCITGVSGSGKSSLINEILFPYLAKELNRASAVQGNFDSITFDNLDKAIAIDQSPIGRTPRSNPATYTGTFTDIRELYANTADSKERGYKAGRFSFNVPGGRCEHCSGDGIIKIEMHFLPDIYVPCEVCKGKRYNRETLQVKYKGKNIHDILDMTVSEACDFFENLPRIHNKIKTLKQVGLGYIKLGQPAPTLSGGEAQRVKLATELSKRSTGKTVYILDEPTTGLHIADVAKLIKILKTLSDNNNTVIVIEHNLEVIKVADYIIDLGPEGGDKGGQVIACGSPEEIAENPASYTGRYLKKYLQSNN